MGEKNNSLSEVFGQKVPFPAKPMDLDGDEYCPFLDKKCQKGEGVDDERIKPMGSCSIWYNNTNVSPKKERSFIICPKRFYVDDYYHLWSLANEMTDRPLSELTLVPEVKKIDWVIYSEQDEIVGGIEVQSLDTTSSYKDQLFYLRNIEDDSSNQYPEKVGMNWKNAITKRFYPQVVNTIQIMNYYDAPVGLMTQDIVKDYLVKRNWFPAEDGSKQDPEVVWMLLNNEGKVGTTEHLDEEVNFISQTSMFQAASRAEDDIPDPDDVLPNTREKSDEPEALDPPENVDFIQE